jgi:hypothetical protein
MKPDEDDPLDGRGDVSGPGEYSPGRLQPPEIVGEVGNPVLESIRRHWWRAFDHLCYCIVLIRLSIHDRIFGPEPPTPADLKREADHERLLRAFPTVGEAIDPTKYRTGQNRDGD